MKYISVSISVLVNHFSNTSVIKKMEVINLTPLRVGWKLTLLISITYIISLSSILIYQTYPLSILEKNKVIDIDCFQISLEEKSSYVNINGYYKTNFNRLNQLFSTKLQTNQEPIYGVYTLNEPYKSKNTTLYGILVVGWNQDATTIQITYNDKTYTEKINTGIFAVAYPDLVSNRPVLDIYTNFTSNLNVTFYDAYNNMIEIPFNQFLAEY